MCIDQAIQQIISSASSEQRKTLISVLDGKTFCPTGAGGGVDPSCGGSGGSHSAAGPSLWVNPNHKIASQISGVTPADTKVAKKKAYHITTKEAAESILKNGFDLAKVKPRWQNDYAVSLSKGKKSAEAYFTTTGGKFNSEKYTVLEVEMKGRYAKDLRGIPTYGKPQDYTKRVIDSGHDGQDLDRHYYVHNPKSILTIRSVPPES